MAPLFLKNQRLVKGLKKLRERINSLMHSTESLSREIEEARKDLLYEQIDTILRNTSAEVLRDYHSGARIQPISHYSLRDIQQLSQEQLASIRGIGATSAYLIKECTSDYARRVIQNHRLRITPENRTARASRLVQKIYQYDKMSAVAQKAKELNEKLTDDQELVKQAKAAANPLRWVFSRKKQNALDSIDRIQSILQSPLVVEVEKLEGKSSDILRAEHEEYWGAFRYDPARFYAILSGTHQKPKQEPKSEPRRPQWENAVGQGNKQKRPDVMPKQRVDHTENEEDIFSPELRNQIEKVELNTKGLHCILRPYQVFGVKYILNQGNVLLGDEMGLGKTIEAIAAMVSLRNNGATRFVVVCPASVLVNWEREITKHSDMKCFVLHGADYFEQYQKWVSEGGIAITNYENTARFVYEGTVAMTVVDEAHYIKNRSAARTRNTLAILEKSSRRLFMTGTPLENRLDEMVELIGMLQPEIAKRISRMYYVKKEAFRHEVAPVYFRRTKDSVWDEMPELQVIEDVVELTEEEREKYIELVSEGTMAAFAKLRQISFMIDNDKNSSKLTRIAEICEEAFANGRKVLIFSFYLNTIKRIKDSLGDVALGPITGSISPEARQGIIDDFSHKEGGVALLAQVLAGGTGLNIQEASIVIMCEPQYKPSTENQAIARAYRIGQISNVTVYRLLGEKTVDERILQILKEKQAIFDAYANKSESGEKSITLKETEIAAMEFADSKVS